MNIIPSLSLPLPPRLRLDNDGDDEDDESLLGECGETGPLGDNGNIGDDVLPYEDTDDGYDNGGIIIGCSDAGWNESPQ